MEIILNIIGGIFKPEDESAGDDASLQAALSAQVRRTNYEHRGMATQERKPIKKNSDQRSPKQSGSDLSKLMQVVFDMKAEMGCMRKAMINAGMSFDKSPNEPRIREQFVNGKQKNKFAGAAKKNKASKVAQRSLTLHDKNELTDSDDEDQPLAAKVAIVAKPRKHVSPRTMNALMVGITRRSSEFRRISDSDASVDRELDGEDADAQTSFNGSLHDDLFGNNVQKALESGDARDPQGDAPEDHHNNDFMPSLEPYSDDGASDNDEQEHVHAESEDEIVDETIRPSPTKMRTRSKTRKPVIPESIMCSDPEDDEPRPRQRRRTRVVGTPLRAGTSKYFRRNSNKFPSIASKTFAARKARAGKKEGK
jgi:hypothetical protein